MSNDTTSPLKRCYWCGKDKPATRDHFYKCSKNKDGLFSHCIECHKIRHNENRERHNEIARQSHHRHREERNAISRAYREEHREELTEKARLRWIENKPRIQQWRIDNYDKIRVTAKRYYDANREHYRELNRLYHIEHREEILERKRIAGPEFYKKNREVLAARAKKWRTANISRLRLAGSKRRARVRDLPATFTHDQYLACLAYFHNRCAVCECQLKDLFGNVELHFDHWIPVTNPECPGTVAKNMVSLCSNCNLSKHDKDPEKWLIQKFGKSRAAKVLKKIKAYFDSLA